ncbi:single-stranded DNA-binding protein [Bacillus sp. FJAT-27225]|uniref:single-stranded DNA-binding protein n=1 Tax=Bacillus sp. FJAT-27225 TaxID=1743144 RepID=UPI0009816898|nr:single-stranded DNA-binding protein [Bacillus sp. FJAT-27225]
MINQVTLVGRLTKDPELKVTTEGTYVSNIILAVNRQFRNNHGDIDTDFVQCTLWRKAAENTAQYCRKGSVIGITGRIQTRNYENNEGKKVYVTEVLAESVRFLSSKPKEGGRREEETRKERESVPLPFPEAGPHHGSANQVQFENQHTPSTNSHLAGADPHRGYPGNDVYQGQGGYSQQEPGFPQGPPRQEQPPGPGTILHQAHPVQPSYPHHQPNAQSSYPKVDAVVQPKEEFPFG